LNLNKQNKAQKSDREDFLQLVLNTIPIFVFWKDRNCNYLGCNQNFATAAGLNTPEDIVGLSDYDLAWDKKDSDFYRTIDQEVMLSGIPQLNFEEPQTAKDGFRKWLKTSKIPMFDENNKVIGILGTYEDITEKKNMEIKLQMQAEALSDKNKKLKQSNFDLEQANIDLEQFSYATYHDLQEPLAVIEGFSNLINENSSVQNNEEVLQYAKFIKAESSRMSSLIYSVMSYTKIKEDVENFEQADISEIVADSFLKLEKTIDDSNVKISVVLPDGKIKCQPKRISLLFSNLINNGLKFNTADQPIIEIDFEENDDHWLFSVKDNGIGILEKNREKVFQPFKRLHNRSQFSGNGIGLSISRRIVNLHSGKIWFTSNNSEGTTFFFTLQK